MFFTDGSSETLSRRERPQLVLGQDGKPVALSNGALSRSAAGGRSRTVIVPIKAWP